MHKWLENYVLNDDMGQYGSNPYSKQSHIMAQEIIDKGLVNCEEFWGTEVTLYFPQIYAGTTDLVGLHDGDVAIMDHKQTNRPKKREWIDDYFIQMTAYADAHNELYGTNIKKGVIFMCSKDFAYQEFIVEGKEFDKYHQQWLKKLEEYYIKYI
jgi:genome maintenance exonuclease 1